MGAFIVVVIDPFVEIILQLLDGLVDLLSECHLVELLQDGFVEPFADAVGLRRFDFGLGVVDVVDGQEQLVIVPIGARPQYSVPRSVRIRSGIDAPIDRQVLSMSAKGCSSVQGEERVREEGGRVLGRRSA